MPLVTAKISGRWWFVREAKATVSNQSLLPTFRVHSFLVTKQGSTGRSAIVDSLKLSEDIGRLISKVSAHAVHVSGGFGDVYIGKHSKVGKVALKRPRLSADLDEAVVDVSASNPRNAFII